MDNKFLDKKCFNKEQELLQKDLRASLLSYEKERIEESFREFYEYYTVYLLKIIREKINDTNDIPDVINETFLFFFKSVMRNPKIEDFKAYLLTIFNYKVNYYNTINKNQREMIKLMEHREMSEIVSEQNNYVIQFDICNAIDKRLNRIEKYIVLCHIVLEIPLKQIKSMIPGYKKDVYRTYEKAIKKIRKELGEDYYEI